MSASLKITQHYDILSADSQNLSAWTTYTYVTTILPWVYDSSLYDGTVKVYFEARFALASAPHTGYLCLWDVTANAQVSGSEISVTGTTTGHVRSADIKANLVSGRMYVIYFKVSTTAAALTLYRANIIVEQSGSITKIESPLSMLSYPSQSVSTTWVETYSPVFTYDSSLFDGTLNIYLEANAFNTGAGTGTIELVDQSNTVVATISVSSSTNEPQLLRSSAITLTNGNSYRIRFQRTSGVGTVQLRGARLVFRQSGSPSKSVSFLNIGGYRASTITFGVGTANVAIYYQDDFRAASKAIKRWSSGSISNSAGTLTLGHAIYPTSTALATTTTTSTTTVSTLSSAFELSNAQTYNTRLKTSNASYTATHQRSAFQISYSLSGGTTTTTTSSTTSTSSSSSSTTSSSSSTASNTSSSSTTSSSTSTTSTTASTTSSSSTTSTMTSSSSTTTTATICLFIPDLSLTW